MENPLIMNDLEDFMCIYLGKKLSPFTTKDGQTLTGFNLFFARVYSSKNPVEETEDICYVPLRRSIWVSENHMKHIDEPLNLTYCDPVFNEFGKLVCIDPCDDD